MRMLLIPFTARPLILLLEKGSVPNLLHRFVVHRNRPLSDPFRNRPLSEKREAWIKRQLELEPLDLGIEELAEATST